MAAQEVRFHEVCGTEIILSSNRLQAQTTPCRYGLCFTSRPLASGETLTVIYGPRDRGIRVGVIENDPRAVQTWLPNSLPSRYDPETGIRPGTFVNEFWQSRREITFYFEGSRGRLMCRIFQCEPKACVTGIRATESVYITFELCEISLAIVRTSFKKPRPVMPNLFEDGILEKQPITPAKFAGSAFRGLSVRQFSATNLDSPDSMGKFAFVETPLKPDSCLIVKLIELKNGHPLEIVLTTEDADTVYSRFNLSNLLETTDSSIMQIENAESGDELAVGYARNGAVSLHLNRGPRVNLMYVDASLEYHVVFSMQNITTLGIDGILTAGPTLGSPSRAGVSTLLPECVVCLVNARTVAITPCFHFALCETCAQSILHSDGARCPVCRAHIAGVQKIYL